MTFHCGSEVLLIGTTFWSGDDARSAVNGNVDCDCIDTSCPLMKMRDAAVIWAIELAAWVSLLVSDLPTIINISNGVVESWRWGSDGESSVENWTE